jgi:hypothetical protein
MAARVIRMYTAYFDTVASPLFAGTTKMEKEKDAKRRVTDDRHQIYKKNYKETTLDI